MSPEGELLVSVATFAKGLCAAGQGEWQDDADMVCGMCVLFPDDRDEEAMTVVGVACGPLPFPLPLPIFLKSRMRRMETYPQRN